MDEADIAQRQEERQRESAIEAALVRHTDEQHRIGDRVYCLDCADEIPETRLAANPRASRCIDCQAAHERRRM